MKKVLHLFFLVLTGNFVLAQSGPTTPWVWVRNSNQASVADGEYNNVTPGLNTPGSREGAATWTDAAGKLWLFGGGGRAQALQGSGLLNDLWRYDPITNIWTYVSGTSLKNTHGQYGPTATAPGTTATTNWPGARKYCATWIDASGNFWLFGGEGYGKTLGDAGTSGGATVTDLSDLWRYNPATNEWTWMSGINEVDDLGVYPGSPGPTFNATYRPRARHAAMSWVDATGAFWLFGGHDADLAGTAKTRLLNDLWKYDPAINQWAWINGDNALDVDAIYPTKPGAREEGVTWIDASGNLWLFGGVGRDAPGGLAAGFLSDVWRYEPLTNAWTWLGGNTQVDQYGVYNTTAGVPEPGTIPGGRRAASIWKDASGLVGIFGGNGMAESAGGHLNDFWKYDPVSNVFTWVKGDKAPNVAGVYTDPQGTFSTVNKPGARRFSSTWVDGAGDLWLFGGTNASNGMNDLWKISAIVLPVKYESFTAEKVNGTAVLKWVTSQELNSSRFEVQHSNDGRSYTPIGTVTAAGNSNERTSYSFVHTNPDGGPNFYRLKQIDLDGKSEFSETRKLTFESGPFALNVTGNPFDKTLQYRISSPVSERATLRFTDITGRVVWTRYVELQKGATTSFTENTAHYPSGVYILSLSTSLQTKQVKVMKR